MQTNLNRSVIKIVTHSKTVLAIAAEHGWRAGARYTNLRDVREHGPLAFLDIHWRDYQFAAHLRATKSTRPYMTVAQDVVLSRDLAMVTDQAHELALWATHVIVVPKATGLADGLEERIPSNFLLGYSVPTRYGGTSISVECFKRPVHLLGGRPDAQRRLAERLPVVSFDCNRFTLDAAFGDFFDGERFRPHPEGGYRRCLSDSIANITSLWKDYRVSLEIDKWLALRKAA